MSKQKNELMISVVVLLTVYPMWYFLLYSILIEVDVDRLVWFIYWIYVPVNFFLGVLKGINESIYN